MNARMEHDALGQVAVPADKYWGAQTQRSVEHFPIGAGSEPMPIEIIRAFAILKKSAALANLALVPDRMSARACETIGAVCDEILSEALDAHFPLVVWQTGSGTHTNMNVNEVIANRAKEIAGIDLHPNDDVNRSQSSNDTFPSALHIAAVLSVRQKLLPAVRDLIDVLKRKEAEFSEIIKMGRTHLMDAAPIRFSQEISGWRTSLEQDATMLETALLPVCALAIGGTAVGTGLNAPKGFGRRTAEEVARFTGEPFHDADNTFHALTARDEIVFLHGAVKALAADCMKIANDVRFLASGPNGGLGELILPANEPGSSIMPGKVNPTQCEALTMVAVQVFGNDAAIGFAASQGNFELNVYLPVIAYNFLQSSRLLSDAIASFNRFCIVGMAPNPERMRYYLEHSAMIVTALTPAIGYERAAEIVHFAQEHSLSVRNACLRLGILSADRFDVLCRPETMV